MTEPKKHTNRLIDASSPYLLQHAHNPVDWHEWGEQAFAEARRRDVPIFLSVGYSTCYWCHVMERESFESERTAAVMNDRFVCIKVDREERPDVDELSMASCVTFSGRGGWPTSVFLEPGGLRPFFAGTYFPPEERHGIPSFERVLESLSHAWRTRRGEVLEQCGTLADAVTEQLAGQNERVPLGPSHVQKAVNTLLQIFDRVDGGFGSAPKFPQPIFVEFLLDVRERTDDESRAAIDTAVRSTLDAMAIGGIRDHLGGGFHRYSVDKHWTVPHFEKMLYDNGQLASLYARASRVYADPWYAEVARTTCDYVCREMTGDPDRPGVGGFFSAQDAEVDQREGLNYLWTPEQFDDALGPDGASFASRVYNLDASANFQDPHHPDDPPAWVLRLSARPASLAEELAIDPDAFRERLASINMRLLAVRDTREQPMTDDKVIVSWNALMIEGLIETSATLGAAGARYIDAARNAARTVLKDLRSESGALLRVMRHGKASIAAPLEDHAFLARALLLLGSHDPAGRAEWVDAATALLRDAESRFGDGAGGYLDSEAGRDDLFVRSRSTHDGATPAPSGVLLHAMLDAHAMTDDAAWLDKAAALLDSLSGAVDHAPVGTLNPVRAVLRMMELGAALGGRYAFDFDSEFAPKQPEREPPVRVLAKTERVEVEPDSPAVFRIAIEIKPGYHIVAAEPIGDSEGDVPLMPLRVGLTKGSGVAVYADYPPGEPYKAPEGIDGIPEILVHHERLEFDVVLEHKPGVGVAPGVPVVGVSYQACSDTECAPPRTVELDIAVDIKA